MSAYPFGNTKYKNKLHNIVFTDVDVDLNIWCQKHLFRLKFSGKRKNVHYNVIQYLINETLRGSLSRNEAGFQIAL